MNRKPNSHNASGIRGKGLLRITFCCAFMATAMLSGCVKEVSEPQPDKDGVVSLQIKAAISDGVETKAPILETNFPVSDVGTVSNIGLFMMQGDGTTPYATGSDNMTAELTGKTGPVYTCRYQYRNGAWMAGLSFYISETIQLWGYYPRNEGAIATAIPFDLTTPSEQTDQTDILWCPPQTVTATSANFTESVSLSFQHAYALLEFQVKTKVADPGKPAIFTRTEVMNKSGKNWIANKGSINPQTGTFSATEYGTVSINCSATLATDRYTSIRVMVPAFSDAYADDDIEVQFTGNDLVIQKFMIKASYLSEQSGNFGFTAGKKYSFKLLYNNFGDGSLTLLPWIEDGEDGNVGDDSSHGTVNISPWATKDNAEDIGEVPYKGPYPGVDKSGRIIVSRNEFGNIADQSTLLTDEQIVWLKSTNSSTVAYRTDSDYNKVSAKFEVAIADCNATNAVNVPVGYTWANAFLACDAYSENGVHKGDWRMPTQKEAELRCRLNNQLQFPLTGYTYWTSSQSPSGTDYAAGVFPNGGGGNYGVASIRSVRCIRDL